MTTIKQMEAAEPSAFVTNFALGEKIDALEAENAALRGALTPTSATKFAFIGEFKQDMIRRDEDGVEYVHEVSIEWTTIKEIMAAIKAYAARTALGDTQ